MEKRKSFILHFDSLDVLDELSEKQISDLFLAIRDYNSWKDTKLDWLMKAIFIPFKNQFDRDLENSKIWEYHWNWKWWITNENNKIRSSTDYKNWRKSVFDRDNFTCVMCWKIWWTLNAHHIEHFSKNKEKRLDINNWITLCKMCHILIHKNK